MQNFLRQGAVKILPIAKDQVVIRLENLADLFDGPRSAQPHYINIQKFGRELYQSVNNKLPEKMIIEEMSLSNSMPIYQLYAQKFKWTAIGDEQSLQQPVQSPVDRGGLRGIALEA